MLTTPSSWLSSVDSMAASKVRVGVRVQHDDLDGRVVAEGVAVPQRPVLGDAHAEVARRAALAAGRDAALQGRGGGFIDPALSSPTVLGLDDPASDRGLPCVAASNAAALAASRRAVASSRLICAGALRSAMGLEPKKSPASMGSSSKYSEFSSSRSSSSSSSSVGLDAYVSSSYL